MISDAGATAPQIIAPDADGPALLDIRNLKKSFVSGGAVIEAISDMSLTVGPGEFVTLLGPSGCGKSTLLHMVGGFDSASGGEIMSRGNVVKAPGPDRGMMFQDLALFPWLTVLENIVWPLDIKKVDSAESRKRGLELIELVHLHGAENLYPAQLSGGMKQRVALARLLALDPAIMLMDEPFGALDAQTRELLQEELQLIWRMHQKTVLFVTHDIDEAIFLGTRLIVFTARPGRIKLDIKIPVENRTAEFRTTPEFNKLRVEIWASLREEVNRVRSVPGL